MKNKSLKLSLILLSIIALMGSFGSSKKGIYASTGMICMELYFGIYQCCKVDEGLCPVFDGQMLKGPYIFGELPE